jgi:hypothetical protein
MKLLKRNWFNLALMASAGVVVLTLFASGLLWGQTAPGLSILVTPTNQISLIVTNGTITGQYQIYFTEYLDPENVAWTLYTNGSVGQSNFAANMGDFEQGFFKAVNNTNFIAPSITVIIQSPLNGTTVY